MDLSISDLRRDYALQSLDEADVDPDPVLQFHRWFQQAVASALPEPNAMTLATSSAEGIPSARIVLLKGFDDQGFVFYTNYESRKGQELAANGRAALVFWWAELERQVRIEGAITKVSGDEADAYFHSRPLASRLGAWASAQSRVLSCRQELEDRMQRLQSEYADRVVPRPPHWGGYRLTPSRIEFWQGRTSRLHDRMQYTRFDDTRWKIERLSP